MATLKTITGTTAQHSHETEAPPPLATVLLRVSATIERDYAARGVFPDLRYKNSKSPAASTSLHYVSVPTAEAIVKDAMARLPSVRAGLRNAYGAHVKALRLAIKVAVERARMFTSSTATCLEKSASSEHWVGTKEQLLAQGFIVRVWPRSRWAQALSASGYSTSVTCYSSIWPGLYEARVRVPYEIWSKTIKPTIDPDVAEKAQRDLEAMPGSTHEYRVHLAERTRTFVRALVIGTTTPVSWHGYTLDEESVCDIQASTDAVVEAIVRAKVNFDAARHAQIAQGHRAQIAAADPSFQVKFATLVRSNPSILEGGV